MKCDPVPVLELLDGELTQQETRVVLQHLEACQVCQERVRLMLFLRSEGHQIFPQKKGNRRILVAAAAVVLSFLSLTIWQISRNPGLSDLATQEPYQYVALHTRDSENGDIASREKAFQYYLAGDFESAAQAFTQIPPDPETEFYRGVAEYLAGQPERAVRILSWVGQKSERWRAPALWYQAQAALRMEDAEKARGYLTQLAGRPNEYRQESQSLLRKISQGKTQ